MISKELLAVARGDLRAELVFRGGRVFDAFNGVFVETDLAVHQGRIAGMGDYEGETVVDCQGKYLIPGFIDAHVHLESSMMTPDQFSGLLLSRGTTAVVADPHELANVYGMHAVDYLLGAAERIPLDLFVMLPSCVPATEMETAGAVLEAEDLEPRMGADRVLGLGEMMNFPGVIQGDDRVLAKLEMAGRYRKPLDGHMDTTDRNSFNAYAAAGIEANHECTTPEAARLNLENGLRLMIREGTATKNLEALLPVVNEFNLSQCMFCTDDRHPDHIRHEGHIDYMVRRSISLGIRPEWAIRMASLNAAQFFGLKDRGALQPGKLADMLVVSDLDRLEIDQVYKSGVLVAEHGEYTGTAPESIPLPEGMKVGLNARPITREDLVLDTDRPVLPVIGIIPNEVVTRHEEVAAAAVNMEDFRKIVVVERHHASGNVGVGLIRGFDFRNGAIGSTIAHDSHNIVISGDNDEDILAAFEELNRIRGGLVVVSGGEVLAELPLPIGGLLSDRPYEEVEEALEKLRLAVESLGDRGRFDPFMTLAFMALPVIPELKITDRGMFDVMAFRHLDQ